MALTPEQEQRLAALEAKSSMHPVDARIAELEAKANGGNAPTKMPIEEAPLNMTEKAIVGTGKALDYLGGGARLAAAGLANIPYAISTGKSLTKEGDFTRALKGEAPTTAEYLDRAGVPEGAHVNLFPEVKIPGTRFKIGEGDTSVRDAAGMVGDVALDPLTYLSLGSSAAAKSSLPIKAITTPVGESIGKKLFKSGLKNVDEKLLEKGAKPVSDILWKADLPSEGKVWGTTKQIQEQSKELMEGLKKQRALQYNVADTAGAMVNPRAALSDSLTKVQKLRENPGLRDLADKLEKHINKYIDEGPVSLEKASDWKTSLRDSLPNNAFDPNGRLKNPVKKIEKSMASGFKTEIENAADAAVPGTNIGKDISKTNEEWGSLIAAQKPLEQQAKIAKGKHAVSSIDALLAGTYAAGHPLATTAVLGAKKIGDLSKTTGFRTGAGRLAQFAGATNIPDYLARRELSSPWLKMNKKENE